MPDFKMLAQKMFGDLKYSPESLEEKYPPRALPEGTKVTRFAPSPTGYLHFGALFGALTDRRVAGKEGVFYLRLEDTDKKREVDDGAADIINGLRQFGIQIDEGFVASGTERGEYGPYKQSARAEIYHAYVKRLVEQGLAYPCFCSAEQLSEIRAGQEKQNVRTGYYGQYAACRGLSAEEAIAKTEAGTEYVVRLRSPGQPEGTVSFDDQIKGKITMPENTDDIVLLKSDGVPTYHFAHAVDDHLMRTTHVIRGDEWISSAPVHLQLFRMLGFKPPKYAHTCAIMKEENGGKRKLSKRKDPEAALHFFHEEGFPVESVSEYMLTLMNSDYEDWRRRSPQADNNEFPFALKKMGVSGALFDYNKLLDVSKTAISRMTAEYVAQNVIEWAREYSPEFHALLVKDKTYAEGIFAIDRGGNKPRKDIAKWSDCPAFTQYFFDELFDSAAAINDNAGLFEGKISPSLAAAALKAYSKVYDPADERQEWFDRIKGICEPLGFCPDTKEYKQNPDAYHGHAGDISTIIRAAVTGRQNTPDLCSIMSLIGRERALKRINAAIENLNRR